MEVAYSHLKQQKSTLSSDKTMRMSQRPGQGGRGYEDLGSDFGPGSSHRGGRDGRSLMLRSSQDSSQKTSRVGAMKTRSVASDVEVISSSDSEDELNVISAGATNNRPLRHFGAQRTLVSEGSRDSTGRNAEGAMIDGQLYSWEKTSKCIQKLNFKKKSAAEEESSTSEVTNSSSVHYAPVAERAHIATPSAARAFKPPSRVDTPDRSSNDGYKATRRQPSRARSALVRQGRPAEDEPTPRANGTRVKHCPVAKPRNENSTKESENKKIASFPMDGISPMKETNKASSKGKTRTGGSSSDDSPVKGHRGKGRPRQRPAIQAPLDEKTGGLQEFPMPSPLANKSDRAPTSQTTHSVRPKALTSFPSLSPLSSPGNRQRSKEHADHFGDSNISNRRSVISGPRVDSALDDAVKIPKPPPIRKLERRNLRPFPMETQVLASISHSKRGSSEGIHIPSDDEARDRKRPRGGDEILRELMSDSEDEMFLDPNVDPSTLCPWCDEPLPPAPSPYLQNLIASARARSYKDPRVSNPQGLHAPATVFVNVCHRHEFEGHHFPLAQDKGWPVEIEWDGLAARVLRLQSKLQAIVDDVDEDFEPGKERFDGGANDQEQGDAEDDGLLLDYRPRKGSLFWIDITRSVKRHGSSNAAGVRAQMANFSKSQPGYYGELGALLLSQTLYDLFPPLDFAPNSTLPLTPAEFVQRILLPETALSLIMEDMHQTRKEAIATMRESAQYGVAMFPDDNVEGTFAGESIVKKRAAARRKQLEMEERDEDMHGELSSSLLSERGSATRSESTVSAPERRNASRRAKSTLTNYAESDSSDVRMITGSGASDTGKVKKPSTKRRIRTKKAMNLNAPGTDTEASDAPTSSFGTKPRPKPRPIVKPKEKENWGSDAELDFEMGHPASSHIEPAPSQLILQSQRHVNFNAKGKAQITLRRDDGTWQTDADVTPRPVRHTKKSKSKKSVSRSSSIADFALHIEPVANSVATSSRGNTHDEWRFNIREDCDSDDELVI
ncbi:RTC4-like domain-containing protein [Cytidiella melzeri]|nr:RTC4-like domain-containing protein [Cytidiella melzeri]